MRGGRLVGRWWASGPSDGACGPSGRALGRVCPSIWLAGPVDPAGPAGPAGAAGLYPRKISSFLP